MEKDKLKELIAEAKRIEEVSIRSAKSQFEAADKWKQINLWLGIPTALLSGIAGISILSNWSYLLGGSLALLVASLTALMTFLNPDRKSNSHLNSGNNYLSLRNKSRLFRNITTKTKLNFEDLVEKLKELADMRDSLNKSSPQFSRKDFEKAKKGISEGEADYQVDSD